MTNHLTMPLGRTVIALAAVTALTLTGCSEGEVAEFEDGAPTAQAAADDDADAAAATHVDAAEQTAAAPLVAESGLIHEDISQAPAVLDTLRPANGEVVTPAGTLTVRQVEVVESVPSEEIGLEGEPDQEQAVPAEGEEFRILTMTFTPDAATVAHGDDRLDVDAALALNVGGVQQHLHDLTGTMDMRTLVSVPQDGSASLTISSEGHDQFVDVLTGERAEDEVAAGYYREVTNQDLNHSFPLDSDTLALQHERRDSGTGEVTVTYDVRVNAVGLSAWAPEQGWAAPGQAWLMIDWGHEILEENDVYSAVDINDVTLTLTADLGDEQMEVTYKDKGGRSSNRAETISYLAVPNEVVDVALSTEGSAVYEIVSGNYVLVDQESAQLQFATDVLEVSLPDTRYGSAHDEVEDAEEDTQQEDQAEETVEPDQDGSN